MKFNVDRVVDEASLKVKVVVVKECRECHDRNELEK